MQYLPQTSEDIAEMLKVIGVSSLDDLFKTIPADNRFKGELSLPAPLTEWDLNALMDSYSASMAASPKYKVFLGAGSYNHHIPATVPYLMSRSEFVTAYTPYQPEVSQGTLQYIYEFQTLCTRLLGIDVVTASHYNGATALAETLIISARAKKRSKVAVSSLIHPLYRQVINTYFKSTGLKVVELPYLPNGQTDLAALDGMTDVGAVAVQSPNFFGCVENLQAFADKTHELNAFFVAAFTEALAFGLLKSPGSQGADFVTGEGQSLGVPQCFGGPSLGILGSTQKLVRNLPGRLIGKTVDLEGKPGFVMTLATREQHIRREKASSNICSNQSLCSLAAVIYMACVGGTGFKKLAKLNYDKSEYLKGALKSAGFKVPFQTPTFNEFVVEIPGFDKAYGKLLEKNIVAGLPLVKYYPELANHYLMCVTETLSKEDMDTLVREIKS